MRIFINDNLNYCLPKIIGLVLMFSLVPNGLQAVEEQIGENPTRIRIAHNFNVTPFSKKDEARLSTEFDRLSHAVLRTGETPGLAWVMVSHGRVVKAKGYGVSDVNTGSVVKADTVFRMASLSKAFASTLAGLLVDEGILEWGDRVQSLVPAFLLQDQEDAGKLRIDELLSHRVGLPYNTYDRLLESEEPYPMLVEKLDKIQPLCSVGDCYAYQNVAFSMIGDVVFAVTGEFFSYQVEKRIFHPLGMHTATYGRDALFSSKSFAHPHIRSGNRWVSVTPKETYYHVPPAAGVNASANDIGQWLLAQLGHRPDVLPSELLSVLHTPQVATPGELSSSPWRRERLRTAAYALGWRVYDYAGHNLVFHAGAVQGYRAMLGLLPDKDFGVAIFWNAESAIPSGLLPTVLDRRLGLPLRDWLELSKVQSRKTWSRQRKKPR